MSGVTRENLIEIHLLDRIFCCVCANTIHRNREPTLICFQSFLEIGRVLYSNQMASIGHPKVVRLHENDFFDNPPIYAAPEVPKNQKARALLPPPPPPVISKYYSAAETRILEQIKEADENADFSPTRAQWCRSSDYEVPRLSIDLEPLEIGQVTESGSPSIPEPKAPTVPFNMHELVSFIVYTCSFLFGILALAILYLKFIRPSF